MATVQIFRTIAGLQTFLRQTARGKTVGLVPTMGALHAGHESLIQAALAETDVVVVSIFVNPLQFGPDEDLDQYPCTWDADCERAKQLGVAAIFAPTAASLGLPTTGELEPMTTVNPPQTLVDGLCGPHRPGHFTGVATIVTKLFTIVCPDRAYFGQKDAQQLAIIQRLVKDLNLTVAIRPCPIVRTSSGPAWSSRNQYLSPDEQQQATVLSRALQAGLARYQAGEKEATEILQAAQTVLATEPGVKVQYLSLVDADSLAPITGQILPQETGLFAIAAYVGNTRLVDNVLLQPRAAIIAIDGPAGAGKSTVTRQVADQLGLTYLDTGAMYRAIAWLVYHQGIDPQDEASIAEQAALADIELIPRPAPQLTGVMVNGQDVSEAIRTPEVTQLVSTIAAQGAVRARLLDLQQAYGQRGGVVAEGRDIGTAVFPQAGLKIYLTASVAERARRRLKDFQNQGQSNITFAQLEQEIAQRDHQDSTRAIAPLCKAVDAVEVVTDGLTIAAVIERIIDLYQQRFA